MIRKMMLAVTAILLSSPAVMMGQMGTASAGPALGSQVAPSKSADALLRIFEGECMSAAKAMPADKYDFSPASLNIAGAKFDGVRTFGEQVKHLAGANFYFASVVAGGKPEMDDKTIGAMKTKDEIVAALASSFAALHKANATLTVQNAFEVVDFEGQKATRLMAADFSVAHGFDHYGQMVEYLRMNGIVPPASAK
jgi:hypothetical protein